MHSQVLANRSDDVLLNAREVCDEFLWGKRRMIMYLMKLVTQL